MWHLASSFSAPVSLPLSKPPGISEAAGFCGVFFFTLNLLYNCCSLILPYHLPGIPFGQVSNDLGEFLALLSLWGLQLLVFVVGDVFYLPTAVPRFLGPRFFLLFLLFLSDPLASSPVLLSSSMFLKLCNTKGSWHSLWTPSTYSKTSSLISVGMTNSLSPALIFCKIQARNSTLGLPSLDIVPFSPAAIPPE